MPSKNQELRLSPPAYSRYQACLLAGAIGDALGGPVEFLPLREIQARFGPEGATDYAPAYGGVGRVTDDTQMTLFTAEALLLNHVRGFRDQSRGPVPELAAAYLRWLGTQGDPVPLDKELIAGGFLASVAELQHARAPGLTCLNALSSMADLDEEASNGSKGCGGVMRVAPIGLYFGRRDVPLAMVFRAGAEACAITHGHPSGQWPGGVMAALVYLLVRGHTLKTALPLALELLQRQARHEETLKRLTQAMALADSSLSVPHAIAQLGEGWVAEEALAIALYCALAAPSLEQGVIWAINHDGDSDSTGSIAGQLLGLMHGLQAIPQRWLEPLEMADLISRLATDLADCDSWVIPEAPRQDSEGWDGSGLIALETVFGRGSLGWRRLPAEYSAEPALNRLGFEAYL